MYEKQIERYGIEHYVICSYEYNFIIDQNKIKEFGHYLFDGRFEFPVCIEVDIKHRMYSGFVIHEKTIVVGRMYDIKNIKLKLNEECRFLLYGSQHEMLKLKLSI